MKEEGNEAMQSEFVFHYLLCYGRMKTERGRWRNPCNRVNGGVYD